MRLYSYVVARDYGFAPNPFHGVCTLATCKPGIREHAVAGDWIAGTGSKRRNRQGFLVYVMQVSEALTFGEYWRCPAFRPKRPQLGGSRKQAFGDNIYVKDERGCWHQENSHHSRPDGTPNEHNVAHDTQVDRVLVGREYAYWGGTGPPVPRRFRQDYGVDVCAQRGYKCRLPEVLVEDFVEWFRALDVEGYLGSPLDWSWRKTR